MEIIWLGIAFGAGLLVGWTIPAPAWLPWGSKKTSK